MVFGYLKCGEKYVGLGEKRPHSGINHLGVLKDEKTLFEMKTDDNNFYSFSLKNDKEGDLIPDKLIGTWKNDIFIPITKSINNSNAIPSNFNDLFLKIIEQKNRFGGYIENGEIIIIEVDSFEIKKLNNNKIIKNIPENLNLFFTKGRNNYRRWYNLNIKKYQEYLSTYGVFETTNLLKQTNTDSVNLETEKINFKDLKAFIKPYEDRIKLLESQVASLSEIILTLTNNSPISPNFTPINNEINEDPI